MNSLASLIALLRYADQLATDFRTEGVTPTAKEGLAAAYTRALSDAKAQLQSISSRPIGHDIPIDQDS